MYLLDLYFKNARKNKTGKLVFKHKKGFIQKWTFLPLGSAQKELLQLIAMAVCGTQYLPHIPYSFKKICLKNNSPLHIELTIARDPKTEGKLISSEIMGSGVRIFPDGSIQSLQSKQYQYLSCTLDRRVISGCTKLSNYLLLAYGSELTHHNHTDDFDFNNPHLRITRFYSLFDKKMPLTDPVAFLKQLRHRVQYKRIPPSHIMGTMCNLLTKYIEVDTKNWMKPDCDFRKEWSELYLWQKRMILPVLDACRHVLDAFSRDKNLLEMPGVILLHRPDIFCTAKKFASWINLMDSLFPNIQFIVTVSEKAVSNLPANLSSKILKLPEIENKKVKRKKTQLPPGTVLLVDVDSRLPNLASMKLSRYYKEQGKNVILAHKEKYIKGAEMVFASCIFNLPPSMRHVEKLKKFYGTSLILGGSGIDICKRLNKEIEEMPADYDLYPVLGDRAIGFITRGCPFKCPFCLVPAKEGGTHQVSSLDSLLEGGRRKLILLDDNIMAHPKAPDFLEEMASREIQVNFTQTLDMRFIDKKKADILRRILCTNTKFTRSNYYFSLNDNKNFDLIRRKYELLGFTRKENVEFICMYGYNTTLAEDVERFRFLHSLPGAYVFVQEYRPISGGPEPDIDNFFDDRADERIDELIRIQFAQNMISMEKYYKWVSMLYIKTFGKLHTKLVDTIFRYNNRHRKGNYIATMAGTGKWPER